MDEMSVLYMLSSKRVLVRKAAIKELKDHLRDSHMARLSLRYVSEHDPCYTVRNIARQAVQGFEAASRHEASWERTYLF